MADAGTEVFAGTFVFFAGAGFASVFGCSVLAGGGGGVTVFSTAGAGCSKCFLFEILLLCSHSIFESNQY